MPRNAFPCRNPSVISISRASRSAPGRSALLMTYRSTISMSPDLRVWIPSPDSGTRTSTVLSAMPVTASSDWPTPTVSMRSRSNPLASRTSSTSRVLVARPPSEPRVAMERMYTPGSSATVSIRIRSPSRAPPEKGLVGSTARTPTVSPRRRHDCTSCWTRVDLPAPGGPVMPIRRACPRREWSVARSSSKPGRAFSTSEMARARAAVRPGARSARSGSGTNGRKGNRPCEERSGGAQSRGGRRSGRRSVQWNGNRRRPAHQYALDPGGGGMHHVHLEAADQEPLAAQGETPGELDEPAAERAGLSGGKLDPELRFDLGHRCGAVHLEGPGPLARRTRGSAGVLVHDLTHHRLQQVLQRHDAERAAELVQHHGEVAALALHVQERVRAGPAARRHGERPDRQGIAGAQAEEVEGMNHAHDLVHRPAIHRQPGEPALHERGTMDEIV